MNKNQNGGNAGAPVVEMNNDNRALVAVKAIDGVPKGMTVNYGDSVLDDEADQIAAVRSYVRAKVLAQYGVVGINHQTVSQMPIGFNAQNVQTKLKLPRVQTNAAGEYAEPLANYYTRVLPLVRQWFKNCLFNSNLTVAQVETIE